MSEYFGILQLNAQNTVRDEKILTFQESLDYALVKNSSIIQSNKKIEQKQQEAKSAKGLFLPKIYINANYTFMTDDIHMDMNPVKDAITPLYEALSRYGDFSGVPNPNPITNPVVPILPDDISTQAVRGKLQEGLYAINNSDWDMMIQQKSFGFISTGFMLPIYEGGKIRAANKVGKISIMQAREENVQKKGELITELVERYYGLLLARNVKEIRQQVAETMEMHRADAEKLKENGIIPNVEYLHAKVYSSEAKREINKVNNQLEIVNNALLNTLGIKDEVFINTVSAMFYIDCIESIDYFINLSKDNSPLLKQIQNKKYLLNVKHHVEIEKYLPTITALGNYNLTNQNLSPMVPDGLLGINLKWTIFEGNKKNSDRKAVKLQQEQVDLYYNKSEQNIATVITKFYNQMQMNLEQIEQLNETKELAKEYYDSQSKAFSEGLSTASDLADANLFLAKVKIEQLQAVYAYDLALSNLLYYAGIPEHFNDYMINKGKSIE